MRIYANENFPGDAVTLLRQRGHDVLWARTDSPGAADRWILERAQIEKRLVVTFDKDFGELAFQHHLPAECGIVLFRMSLYPPTEAIQRIADILEARDDWPNHFSVVETDRIRIRPLL